MGAAPGLLSSLGVTAGGVLGALARYRDEVAVQGQLAGTPYAGLPLATLLVNVTGSFALVFLATPAARGQLGGFWLLTLGTGFVGALTTFSTFELEAHGLLRSVAVASALLYVGGNLFLGYGALLLRQLAAASWT